VACLVRQSLSGQAPLYLADDCCLVSDNTRRSLRSADVPTCVLPRTPSSYGDRTFAAAGPRLWNSLPVQLRNPDITYGLFRRQLKGYLFFRRSVSSDMWRFRKSYYFCIILHFTNCLLRPTYIWLWPVTWRAILVKIKVFSKLLIINWYNLAEVCVVMTPKVTLTFDLDSYE